ncbi:MAG: transposase, partial [Cyanobacteria bacterium J149]
MKRLWGRKVSDLSFSSFLEILTFVANKQDKVSHFLDRYYPNFNSCAWCGDVHQDLKIKDGEQDGLWS